MAKKLRRFKLSGLPQLTRQQVRVANMLLAHLPQTPFMGDFKVRLRGLLEPLLHADVDFWFDGARALGPGQLPKVLGDPTFAAVVGLPPRTDKALLEVDLPLAQQSIDKLLGGNAEDADGQRALTEIEEGVFSFVLLKVLQVFQGDFAVDRSLNLKLESVHGNLASLKERLDIDDSYAVVSFKVFLDTRQGFARIYLPEALVTESFAPQWPTEPPALARHIARLAERVDLVRALRVPLSIEVGRIALQMVDVEALEVDDIIMIDETEVRMESPGENSTTGDTPPAMLSGRVHARVGAGSAGIIAGNVAIGASGRYEVQIENIAPTGAPLPKAFLFRDAAEGAVEMDSENARSMSAAPVDARAHARALRQAQSARIVGNGFGAALGAPYAAADAFTDAASERGAEHSEGNDEEGAAEAAGLLEDITVALVVELGRVTVSAADVLGLRPGQVIELSRSPGEPVDLVVDGKRIGKGELVEIDGELGVRILSLAK